MVTHGAHESYGAAGLSAANLLSRQLIGWDTAVRRTWEAGREAVSTGFRPLDRLLPAGGVRRGSLIEWLAADDACGAIAVACAVACRLATPRSARHGGAGAAATRPATTILVVDRGGRFHPPAVLPWLDALARDGAAHGGSDGAARPQLLVARPSTDDDELWAIDQSLRCPGVAAVLAWPGRVHSTAMRRWQLAARAGGAVGLLVRGIALEMKRGRSSGHRGVAAQAGIAAQAGLAVQSRMPFEATWAEARVAVQSLPSSSAAGELSAGDSVRRLRLSLVGGPWAGDAMLQQRATELHLDLASGCEAVGRRAAAAVSGAARLRDRDGLREERQCRAS